MSDEKLEKYFRQARESEPVYKREDAEELISNIPAGGEGFMSNIFTKIKGSPMTFTITGIAALTTAALLFFNHPSEENLSQTPVTGKKTEIVDKSDITNELKVKESKVSEEDPQEIVEAPPIPKKNEGEFRKEKKIDIITNIVDVKNLNTLKLDEKSLVELGINREDGKLKVNTHDNVLYTIYKSGAKERRELEPNELMGYPEVSMITTANGMRVLEIFSNDGARAIVDRRYSDTSDDKSTRYSFESNLTDDEFFAENFGENNPRNIGIMLNRIADKIEDGEMEKIDDLMINVMTTYLDNNKVEGVPEELSSFVKSFYKDSVQNNALFQQELNKKIADEIRKQVEEYKKKSEEKEKLDQLKSSKLIENEEVVEIIEEAKNKKENKTKFLVRVQKHNSEIDKIIADDSNLSEEDKEKIIENFEKNGKNSMVFFSNIKADNSDDNGEGKTIHMDLPSLDKDEKIKFVEMAIDDNLLKDKIKNNDFEWLEDNLKESVEETEEVRIKVNSGVEALDLVLTKTNALFATKLEHDINKLIPVSVDVDGGEDDFILWYKATDIFLSKLPEDIKNRLAPELAALSDGASCGNAPVEKDQALTDAWSGCSGVVKNMKVFPNPIKNSVVNTEFDLDKQRVVSAAVYDLSGKKVKDLVVNENMGAGQYQESYEINGLNPGLYYLVISTEIGEQALQRIVIE